MEFFDDEPVRDFKRDTTTPAVTTLGNNHIMQGLAFPEQSDSLCLLPFWVFCSVHRESFQKRSLSINRHGRKTLQHGNQRRLQNVRMVSASCGATSPESEMTIKARERRLESYVHHVTVPRPTSDTRQRQRWRRNYMGQATWVHTYTIDIEMLRPIKPCDDKRHPEDPNPFSYHDHHFPSLHINQILAEIYSCSHTFIEVWLHLTELGVAWEEAGDEMFRGQACRHQRQMHTGREPCRADNLAVEAFDTLCVC